MKILSLSSVYPNPQEPGLGLFVRSRLEQMARMAEVKVIAPIPLLDYSNPERRLYRRRTFPAVRQDGPIAAFHPRWLYPPRGTPLNVLCQFLRLLPFARSIRRSFPFDLIDAHFGYPEGATAALLAAALRCPFCVTLRGNEIKFAQYRLRRPVIRWVLRRAARVITVSEELRKLAIALGAEPSKIKTIPNGIDPDLFFPQDREACRRKFQMPQGSAAIVCVGELVARKGHHLVVRALRRIVAEGIDAHLWIAGTAGRDGPAYEQVIRRAAADLGLTERVHLMGFVQRAELPGLLSAADVFCLPSNLEGWPNVVHEASASSAPVVATNVGGVPEMLPSRKYGFVVPVGEQDALDSALLEALRTTWDRDAIAAWGRSRSWKTVADETLETIAEGVSRT